MQTESIRKSNSLSTAAEIIETLATLTLAEQLQVAQGAKAELEKKPSTPFTLDAIGALEELIYSVESELDDEREKLIKSAVTYILANNPENLSKSRVWNVLDAQGHTDNKFYATLPETGGQLADALISDVIDDIQREHRYTDLVRYAVLILLSFGLADVLDSTGVWVGLREAARRYKLPTVSERDPRWKGLSKAVRDGYHEQAAQLRAEMVQPLNPAQRDMIRVIDSAPFKFVQVGGKYPREVADALTALGFTKYENDVTVILTDYGRYAAIAIRE